MKWIQIALLAAACLFAPLALAGPVNINTADAPTLDRELDGVGKKLAERIVAYREQHGRFEQPRDITRVPYVGERTFEKNAGVIRVN